MLSNRKKVQVLIPVQTPTTRDFAANIKCIFEDPSFKCKVCDSYEQISDKVPLVVVCQISSRFEPDIDLALTGVKRDEQFVVIILHTGIEKGLPLIHTAYKLANKEKYKNIKFIDIAYNIDDKFYQCQMNVNAKDVLESLFTVDVKKRKKTQRRDGLPNCSRWEFGHSDSPEHRDTVSVKRKGTGEPNVIDENRQQPKDYRDALSTNYTSQGTNDLDIQTKDERVDSSNNSASKGTNHLNIQTEENSESEGKEVANEQGNQDGALSNPKLEYHYTSEQKDKESIGESIFQENVSSDSKEVQVLVPVETSTTKEFTDVIKSIFKEGLSLECKLYFRYDHISETSPLVVVFQTFSEMELYIDSALTGIKKEERFVAIILYTGLKRNLPMVSTATKLANKEEYKNIKFIDIAFNKDDKLYDCKMNSDAKRSLASFCTEFYK